MGQRSPELLELRQFIIDTGSAYLRNVQRTPGVTCARCGGIPSAGYETCFRCSAQGFNGVDTLGLVTYAWRGGQAGHLMHAYKSRGATTGTLVAAVLAYAVIAHWNCIRAAVGSAPDSWAVVPSLSGRAGGHPLGAIARRTMGQIPQAHIAAESTVRDSRTYNPDHFQAGEVTGHVLLLDDTWATGGHLQSAAAALKGAGARHVTGLVIARWLEPTWGRTRQFLDTLQRDFDPDVCPYTSAHC